MYPYLVRIVSERALSPPDCHLARRLVAGLRPRSDVRAAAVVGPDHELAEPALVAHRGDPQTGEVENAPFEEQAERVMAQPACTRNRGIRPQPRAQVQHLLHVADYFKPFNDVYRRYFEVGNQPARIFRIVPKWTGPFDVEIDCVAVARD